MGKSISKKVQNESLYLDYNATSPLSSSVKTWLREGDFAFGNPSSVHSTGKKAQREISETTEAIHHIYQSEKNYEIFYHSGASEAINTFIRGFGLSATREQQKAHLFFNCADHSCVVRCAEDLECCGHEAHSFSLNEQGDFDKEVLIEKINNCVGPVLLNYTWVNNESGIVWPLQWAADIKKATGCFVHVDAVQSIGKIDQWWELENSLDAYTFSGHKFGALKGVGWSFISEKMPFSPMVRGGGQQQGRRSGTENVPGIISLRFALQELKDNFNYTELKAAKEKFIFKLKELVCEQGIVIGEQASLTNGNTIYLILKTVKADIAITAFDLAQIEISSGSACSSGATLPSRVLLAMGFNEEEAKSGLRFSFSPFFSFFQVDDYFARVQNILSRFL